MKAYHYFKIIIIFIVSLFVVEINSLTNLRMYLYQECEVISYLISKHVGLSSELMTYLKDKDYQFVYLEDNPSKIGEIACYQLKKEIKSFFLLESELTLSQYVILGNYS